MSRYHINPQTGEPGPCRATKNCPFGDLEADHYSSVAAARAGYEASMRDNGTGMKPLANPQSPLQLAGVLDLDVLRRDLETGYIAYRAHHDDADLLVLCYTKNAQQDGHWTEATKIARGLIVRSSSDSFEDAVIEQRPWRKFFTLEQMESGWHLGDEEGGSANDDELARLDLKARAEVTDKMDGSMGILYLDPKGEPALATKGSFGSDQAKYYTNMLRNGELADEASELLSRDADKTFLFEMVGRSNRIVLDYPDDGIVLLGAVRKRDGLYLSALDYADRWSGGTAEVMEAETVGEALSLHDRKDREGVVIRVLSDDPDSQMQLKVKQEEYKFLHRVATNFGASMFRASIRESDDSAATLLEVARTGDVSKLAGVRESLDSLAIHPLLKGVLEERKAAYSTAILPRLQAYAAAQARIEAIPQSYFDQPNPAKTFASEIANEPLALKSDLFAFFQARVRGDGLDSVSGNNVLRSISQSVKADDLFPSEE